MRLPGDFFRFGGPKAWSLVGAVIALLAMVAILVPVTMNLFLERNVSRMVFNHNVDAFEDVRRSLGEEGDTLAESLAATPEAPAKDQPYIVVSIAEHRLWY